MSLKVVVVASLFISLLATGCSGPQQEVIGTRPMSLQKADTPRTKVEEKKATFTPYAVPQLPPLLSVAELIARAPPGPALIDLASIPDPSEASLPFQFRSPEGQFRDEIVQQYKNFYKINTPFFKRSTAREIGLSATAQADQAYSLGEIEDATFYRDLGQTLLNVAVGQHPRDGLAKPTFELFTGRKYSAGQPLSSTEREDAFGEIVALSASTSARATLRMIHVIEGTGMSLQERQAVQTAIGDWQTRVFSSSDSPLVLAPEEGVRNRIRQFEQLGAQDPAGAQGFLRVQ